MKYKKKCFKKSSFRLTFSLYRKTIVANQWIKKNTRRFNIRLSVCKIYPAGLFSPNTLITQIELSEQI